MSDQGMWIFIGLVFVAVFFLAQGLIAPVFGENRQARKRLKERLGEIDAHASLNGKTMASIMREKYLHKLSPWEQALESLPMMEDLATMIEQAGGKFLAYRLVLVSIALGLASAYLAWEYSRLWYVAAATGFVALMIPFLKVKQDRTKRFDRFEEQLPDCIDIIRRAVLAGHPFAASLKMVSEDMEEPAAKEFGMTFADINYGNDIRDAMLGLLGRVPSVTTMALVTALLVQKETGGNLAEILQQISTVIRDRFKFQRKVKTLSAEGRMSAWVLSLVPLGLFLILSVTSPEYLPIMLEHETGREVVAVTVIWSMIGMYLMRRIIRIDV